MKTTALFMRRVTFVVVAMCSFLLFAGNAASAEDESGGTGRVYVLTNNAAANTVVVLRRDSAGGLTFWKEVPTGGLGSGPAPIPPPFPPGPGPNPLDSQDGLVMTPDGRFLLAVNSGSNDVSVFAVTRSGLQLVDRSFTHGEFPVSIAMHERLIYVLNFGGRPTLQGVQGTPTLTGFTLGTSGKLHEIANSTRITGDFGSGPSEIVFSPDGGLLIVTEMFTNMIDVFRMGEDDLTKERTAIPANNKTPLAIAFASHDVLAVTEGDDITPRVAVTNGSTVSTYRITDDDTLEPISKAVPTTQTGACWIRFTPNGRFAYTGNTGSGSLSLFRISRHGELTLVAAKVVDTGGLASVPIDLDITPDGKYLYVLSSLIGTVKGFQIGRDGSLTPVASIPGFPITIQGIVAR